MLICNETGKLCCMHASVLCLFVSHLFIYSHIPFTEVASLLFVGFISLSLSLDSLQFRLREIKKFQNTSQQRAYIDGQPQNRSHVALIFSSHFASSEMGYISRVHTHSRELITYTRAKCNYHLNIIIKSKWNTLLFLVITNAAAAAAVHWFFILTA